MFMVECRKSTHSSPACCLQNCFQRNVHWNSPRDRGSCGVWSGNRCVYSRELKNSFDPASDSVALYTVSPPPSVTVGVAGYPVQRLLLSGYCRFLVSAPPQLRKSRVIHNVWRTIKNATLQTLSFQFEYAEFHSYFLQKKQTKTTLIKLFHTHTYYRHYFSVQ